MSLISEKQKFGQKDKVGKKEESRPEWFYSKIMQFYEGFYTPLESWESKLSLKKKIKSIRPVLPKLWVIKDNVTHFWQKRFWLLLAMKLNFLNFVHIFTHQKKDKCLIFLMKKNQSDLSNGLEVLSILIEQGAL